MRETVTLSDRFKALLASDEYKEKPDTYKDRNWGLIAYPESFPECESWLEQSCLPHYIALHDACQNDDGTPKKPHWHIVLKFSGAKSLKQMKMLLDPRFCLLDPVADIRGAVRYLVHADSPSKHQYDKSIIHGNLDFEQYFAKKTKGYNPADLFQILEDNPQIVTIRGLCGYAIAHNDNALLAYISKRTFFVKELLCETDFRKLQISQLIENNARYQDICNEIKDLKGFIGVPVD